DKWTERSQSPFLFVLQGVRDESRNRASAAAREWGDQCVTPGFYPMPVSFRSRVIVSVRS
ncbi:hypothetical protein, partial [Aeromonas veronii]|uniref:hypothetical protein n=1 Tax=Aeromonas veronii TaxID=654 RepID=UPI0038B47D99